MGFSLSALQDLLKTAAPYAAGAGIVGVPALLAGAGKEPEIGSLKRDAGLGIDTYYAGQNYGQQSPGSFLGIDPTRATDDSGEQARIRAVQDRLRGDIARAKESSDISSGGTGVSGSSTPGGGQIVSPSDGSGQPKTGTLLPGPVTPGPKQGEEKGPQDIWKEIVKQLDPEVAKQRAAIDTENAVRRMLVTNALSMRQSRENTARQVELETIRSWKDLERARIENNSRQTIATAQTIALALTPNQGFSRSLTEAYGAALRPFENFTLK
jgi:hypothetical protein